MKHTCAGSTYELKTCIHCAVRLVKSARPSRKNQEKMLNHISQWHDRGAVIALLSKGSK